MIPVSVCAAVMLVVWFFWLREPVIVPGVRIGDVDVGNMTAGEARLAVEERIRELSGTRLVLVHGEGKGRIECECTLAALGFYGREIPVWEALAIGNRAGLYTRYRERKAAKEGRYHLEWMGELSEEAVISWLKEQAELFLVPPKDAAVSRKDGRFLYTEHEQGKSLLIPETGKRILEAVSDLTAGDIAAAGVITVEAVLQPELPAVTTGIAMRCRSLTGSYTTVFREENTARANNLANAAERLNGTVLYPGEEFSCQDTIGPFTEENGYMGAGSYSGGQMVESVGGGVCQLSSTLYNAVLAAELTVTERTPHSMTVGYVPLARDAAIAWGYKDFRFVNSSEVPVYVEAETKNGELTVRIWGEETRGENRQIRFESVIVKEIIPGDPVITVDSSKPAGYFEVTQEAKNGYEAELYKVILIGGEEAGRELVNKSSYAASPAQITTGGAGR